MALCGHQKISLTFVVGPSSFSATQLCRLKERSLQFTRTRLPNFSSNCFTSGSIPEKSSFWRQHSDRTSHVIHSGRVTSQVVITTWMCFMLLYLCVRVQGEQLQSGLIPHPWFYISRALCRQKKNHFPNWFKAQIVWNARSTVGEVPGRLVLSLVYSFVSPPRLGVKLSCWAEGRVRWHKSFSAANLSSRPIL